MAQKNVLLPGVSGTTASEFSVGGIPIIETVGTAQSTAETAQSTANTAQSTAETAQATANISAPLAFAIGTTGGQTTDTIPVGQRVKVEIDITTAYDAGVIGQVYLEHGEDPTVVLLEDIPMNVVGVHPAQYYQPNTTSGAATVILSLSGVEATQGSGTVYVNRQPAAIPQGA